MAKMCPIDGCKAKQGLCIHDKLIDALTHQEGFIRVSARSGLHVLLVEEADGERRPLVFE